MMLWCLYSKTTKYILDHGMKLPKVHGAGRLRGWPFSILSHHGSDVSCMVKFTLDRFAIVCSASCTPVTISHTLCI